MNVAEVVIAITVVGLIVGLAATIWLALARRAARRQRRGVPADTPRFFYRYWPEDPPTAP